MSYEQTPSPLGIEWGAILAQGKELWSKASPALQVGSKVLEDPYLPQVACEVVRLSNVIGERAPGAPCAPTPATASKTAGVGLRYAVKPLRLYIFHRQHPWVLPLGVLGAFGAVYYLGYRVGKRKGK